MQEADGMNIIGTLSSCAGRWYIVINAYVELVDLKKMRLFC